jgi:hypothetical protein
MKKYIKLIVFIGIVFSVAVLTGMYPVRDDFGVRSNWFRNFRSTDDATAYNDTIMTFMIKNAGADTDSIWMTDTLYQQTFYSDSGFRVRAGYSIFGDISSIVVSKIFSLGGGEDDTILGNDCFGWGYGLKIGAAAEHYSMGFGKDNKITGSADGGWGEANSLSGDYSGICGKYNSCSSHYSFVAGQYDTCTANYAGMFGRENKIINTYDGVFGYRNKLSGAYSFAAGDSNVISNHYNAAFGELNILSSTHGFASGYNNEISAVSCAANGYQNSISGNYGFVAGRYDTVSGTNCGVFGENNRVSGSYSGTFGYHNRLAATYGFVAGYQDTVIALGAVAFGAAIFIEQPNAFAAVGEFDILGSATSGDTGSVGFGLGVIDSCNRSYLIGDQTTDILSRSHVFKSALDSANIFVAQVEDSAEHIFSGPNVCANFEDGEVNCPDSVPFVHMSKIDWDGGGYTINSTTAAYWVNGVDDNLYGLFDIPYKKFNGVVVVDSMFLNMRHIEVDDSTCLKLLRVHDGACTKIDSTRWEGGAGSPGTWQRSQNILQHGDYTVQDDYGFMLWCDCVNDDNMIFVEYFVYLWYHLE